MNQKKYVLKRTSQTGLVKKIDEARFAINYQEELNASQFEAASTVNGCYLIIAGAGTGKTRTLV
ncbi:MAG TPA: UvrD-helicase domain-containing protein, partial [Ignavibacteriaceae bacterium]|nr:UvrD-helicase domain-containing protein [Ignavibacteriaceae bacterium]